jgi:hypothetical protein
LNDDFEAETKVGREYVGVVREGFFTEELQAKTVKYDRNIRISDRPGDAGLSNEDILWVDICVLEFGYDDSMKAPSTPVSRNEVVPDTTPRVCGTTLGLGSELDLIFLVG